MKQRCHRLIQLSFQFPWQSSVIVPTIFSAGEEKKENMGGGDCEIVPNLLEDLLHQGRACAVTCKKIGRVKGRSLEFTELLQKQNKPSNKKSHQLTKSSQNDSAN